MISAREGMVYGIGAGGLSLTGMIFGAFALQWQPVPAGIPGYQMLAYASAAIMLGGAITVLAGRWRVIGFAVLAASFTIWMLLHVPVVVAKPADIAAWLGPAETGALAIGGATGALAARPSEAVVVLSWLQRGFGLCAIVFGLSHFAYADFTANMVPGWIPAPLFWAWATGIGHAAAGLSLIGGVMPRLAATIYTGMLGSFALLVHTPRVAAQPTIQAEWTMLFIALSLTGAAWIMRSATPASPKTGRKSPATAATEELPAR